MGFTGLSIYESGIDYICFSIYYLCSFLSPLPPAPFLIPSYLSLAEVLGAARCVMPSTHEGLGIYCSLALISLGIPSGVIVCPGDNTPTISALAVTLKLGLS